MTSLSFKEQTVFILGLGKSGRSAAQNLYKRGAHVLAWDDQEEARRLAQNQGIPLANLRTLDWKEVDQFIVSPGIPHHYPAPHPLIIEAQRIGLSPVNDLEILYRSQPHARYIGVTGTNGKSTTTSLVAHSLKKSGARVEVGGNLGTPALDLAPLSRDGTYVLEVSSYQLETAPTLHFDVSILLNITPDHLERHGGIEGYIQAKKLIFKNAKDQDTLVISIDDAPCLKIYEDLKTTGKMHLIPISVDQMLSDGISVLKGILYEKERPILDLQHFEHLKGKHNWQNIAAAYGALRTIGLESDEIIPGLLSFPGLAHRQQVVARHKNVLFINDSKATNAEAVEKVFDSYEGSSLYWLVGGRPKEGGITRLRPYFSKLKHAFVFGEAAPLFSSTLEGCVEFTHCQSLDEAVEKASSLAFRHQEPEAVVLLAPACASFDQFKDFEERGNVFCKAVHSVIEDRGETCSP